MVTEQLKVAIRECGMSLNQLQAVSGVGRDQLSRFLRGERSLTLPAVEALCKALGYQLTKVDAPEPTKPIARRKKKGAGQD
ncbi:MAG TPA: helix-turn-helix transcriptional regulator [Gemmataceae bacterium]|nr:helix-turn-helix transcriptional regulator [Gemmataceae bacterium]